jgi:hypothetical protein
MQPKCTLGKLTTQNSDRPFRRGERHRSVNRHSRTFCRVVAFEPDIQDYG